METFKKIVRYISLAALVAGIILAVYGAAVNQTATHAFLALLNERGFKAFVVGILLIAISIAVLAASFGLGKGRGKDKAQQQAR